MERINMGKPKGATRKRKILGRGTGTGRGSTAGRGTKGQNARSGGGVRLGFEGGQMPLYRRIARRGFSNYPFKKEYSLVRLESLNVYKDGDKINRESLLEKGLIRSKRHPIKVLGNGEITKKLIIDVDKLTAGAKEKIQKIGGEIIEQTGGKRVANNGG